MLCEMQLVSSRIWTHVAVSISYDDNHYTTGTYLVLIIKESSQINTKFVFIIMEHTQDNCFNMMLWRWGKMI